MCVNCARWSLLSLSHRGLTWAWGVSFLVILCYGLIILCEAANLRAPTALASTFDFGPKFGLLPASLCGHTYTLNILSMHAAYKLRSLQTGAPSHAHAALRRKHTQPIHRHLGSTQLNAAPRTHRKANQSSTDRGDAQTEPPRQRRKRGRKPKQQQGAAAETCAARGSSRAAAVQTAAEAQWQPDAGAHASQGDETKIHAASQQQQPVAVLLPPDTEAEPTGTGEACCRALPSIVCCRRCEFVCPKKGTVAPSDARQGALKGQGGL